MKSRACIWILMCIYYLGLYLSHFSLNNNSLGLCKSLFINLNLALFQLKFSINAKIEICILLYCSKDAQPQFELRVELWSCALEEELLLVNTPKKLAKKLRNSFGKAAGKKLCPLLDSPDPDTFLQSNPIPLYVLRYPIKLFTDSWLSI